MFTFLLAFFSLIFLLVIHELGHFILAKKFNVKVEEFGIFYPPRIFGKRIGETLYSLNLLPLGAFVKVFGEREKNHPRAFGAKPAWQRALILLGGIISFWIISAILLSIVMGSGFSMAVEDTENGNLKDTKVQIVAIAPNSPAEEAGLKLGDTITDLQVTGYNLRTTKVEQVINFVQNHKGEEIVLKIQRGREVFDVSLVPRLSPPKEEGAMGVALMRTATKKYSLIEAPFRGVTATFRMTYFALEGWATALRNLVLGRPTGVELAGPVGVFSMLDEAASYSISYFLQFIAVISIYIALFNALPIPPTDGGKLVFLFIEKIKGKEFSDKLEAKITPIFLYLLIGLVILITIRDVKKLF